MIKRLHQKIEHWRKDLHLRDLFKGAFVAMFYQVAGVIANVGFSIILARTLGPELAGVFFLGMMFMLFAQIAGGLGLDNAVIRFVAEDAANENKSNVDSIWRQSLWTTLVFSSLLAFILYLSRAHIAQWLNAPLLERALVWFAIGIPPSALLLVNSSALRGIRNIAAAVAFQGVFKSVISIVLILAVVESQSVVGAAQAVVWATVLALILSIVAWRRSVPAVGTIRSFDYRLLMRTALPLVWVSMMMLVVRWTDTLMLGYLATPKDVGLYNIAFRISNLTNFFLVAISAIATPKIAAMYKDNQLQALQRMVRVASLFTLICAAPLFLIVLIWPAWLLSFFGEGFGDASTALRLLVIGHYFCAAAGPLVAVMAMTGLERIMRNVISLLAIFNIVLNWILIPRYGIEGAAISSTIGLVLVSLSYMIIISRRRNIHILPFTFKS